MEARWRELVNADRATPGRTAALAGLSLLSHFYGAVQSSWRSLHKLGVLPVRSLPCPVISVGNLTVGGTGKTTAVRTLARFLAGRGRTPAVLSRGYGAAAGRGGVVVVSGPDGLRAGVNAAGDEPVMLARTLPGIPVVAGKRRYDCGRAALAEFAPDVLILDDGFQHWRLRRDLDIVLLSARDPFGGGRLLPRGTLRESPRSLDRAQAVVVTHAELLDTDLMERLEARIRSLASPEVIAWARHVPRSLRDGEGAERPIEELRTGRLLALSSLGDPRSLPETLRKLGAQDSVAVAFPDHYRYTRADLAALCERVRREGLAGIVTTEKDSVKISRDWLAGTPLWVLEVDLEFLSGQDALESLILAAVSRGS